MTMVSTAQRILLCPWAESAKPAEQSVPAKTTIKIQYIAQTEMLRCYIMQSSFDSLKSNHPFFLVEN